MNIKAIIIFFALTGCIECNFKKLSKEENEDRLETCGEEELLGPAGYDTVPRDVSPRKWTVLTKRTNDNREYLTTRISPRHVLTSSLLVRNKTTWHNGKEENPKCVKKHLAVPQSALRDLRVDLNACDRTDPNKSANCRKNPAKMIAAYILYGCNATRDYLTRLPLIATLKGKFSNYSSFPCLVEENVSLKNNIAHIYDYNGRFRHRKLTKNDEDDWNYIVETPKKLYGYYYGFMISVIKQTETVIGLDDTGLSDQNNNTLWKMSFFHKSICDLSGICPAAPTTTVLR